MSIEIATLLCTVIFGFTSIAYQQGWIPPKYRMANLDLMKVPLTLKLYGPQAYFDNHPRRPNLVLRQMLPSYIKAGYKIVRVIFGREFIIGREIVWVSKEGESVLVARRK